MIPMVIAGSIESVAVRSEVRTENGIPCGKTSYSIGIAPDPRTRIDVAGGGPLGSHYIELGIFCGESKIDILQAPLSGSEIGYLSHGHVAGGELLVGGAVIWPESEAGLLALRLYQRGSVLIYLSNIPAVSEFEPSYQWQPGRLGMLGISSIVLSAKG